MQKKETVYLAEKITGDPEYRKKFACAARRVRERDKMRKVGRIR